MSQSIKTALLVFLYCCISHGIKAATDGNVVIRISNVPTAKFEGDAFTCKGADTELTVKFTGTPPFVLTYSVTPGGDVITPPIYTMTYKIPVVNPLTNLTYTLKTITDTYCSNDTLSDTARVIVNPIPTADFVGELVYCDGEDVPTYTFTGTPDDSHTRYEWRRIGGHDFGLLLGHGVDTIPAFHAENTGIAPLKAFYWVTPYYTNYGVTCEGTTENFMIVVNPVPHIDSIMDMTYCHNTRTPEYVFTSNLPDGVTYIWNRTSLNPSTATGLPVSGYDRFPSFLAVNTDTVPVIAKYHVSPEYRYANRTCSGNDTTFIVTINPLSRLLNNTPMSVCNGSAVTYPLLVAPAGASISWRRDPNAGINEPPRSGTGTIVDTLTNNTDNIVNVRYRVTMSTGTCSYSEYVYITVMPAIRVINSFGGMQAKSCSGSLFETQLTSNTLGTTFHWTRLPNAAVAEPATIGTGNTISETLTNLTPAPATVLYAIVSEANGCREEDTLRVTLSAKLSLSSPSFIGEICSDTELMYAITSVPSAGVTASWERLFNAGVSPHSNYGIGSYIYEEIYNTTTAPVTVRYRIMLTNADGCMGIDSSVTAVIKPLPAASLSTSAVTMAVGGRLSVAVTSPVSTSAQAISSDNSVATAALNAGKDSVVLNALAEGITVVSYEVTDNGCTSRYQLTVTVTRAPLGTLSLLGVNTVCSEGSTVLELTDILFGQAPWTVVLKNSGTWTTTVTINSKSDMPKQIPITLPANTGTTVASYYYSIASVTDAMGAVGTSNSGYIKIDVLPAPTVIPVPENQILCNGSMSDAIYFKGVATAYHWTIDKNIGMPIQGSGDITSFKVINNGTSPVIATLTIIPEYRVGDVVCTGTAATLTITVNPVVRMDAVADREVCAGVPVTIPLTGATTYQWTAVSSIGLSAGTGTVITFQAKNTTQQAINGVVSVIPMNTYGAMDCQGEAVRFTVTVNPVPDVSNVSNREYCNGEQVPAYEFNGSNKNATYVWQRTGGSPIAGLPDNGVNQMPPFKAINTGNTVLTAEYTVTAYYEGTECKSEAKSFTISIYPIPVVPAVATQMYCPEETTAPIILKKSSDPATYYWSQISGPNIGLSPQSGTDTIPSFVTENSSNVFAQTAVIEVVSTISGGCMSKPYHFEMVVNPRPILPSWLHIIGDTIISVGKNTKLTIDTQVDGTYKWYGDPGRMNFLQDGRVYVTPILYATTSYYITMASAFGCESDNEAKVTVHVGEYDIVIPGAITPNGDGFNDDWIIRNIDKFPKNEVLVVNRWGQHMYEKTGYSNSVPWNGYPTAKYTVGGGKVPRGTYFYIIQLNDGSGRVFRGSIEVVY